MLNKNEIIANKVIFCKFLRTVDREGIVELIDYLETCSDFFDAPASTSYHNNFDGGLCDHSLNVYEVAQRVADAYNCNDADSIILCALLHDLGKANYYVPNVLKSGNISAQKPTKIDPTLLIKNHALRSLLLIEQFIDLTEDERVSILAHDGLYEYANKDMWNNPTKLMLTIHHSDLFASRFVETSSNNE